MRTRPKLESSKPSAWRTPLLATLLAALLATVCPACVRMQPVPLLPPPASQPALAQAPREASLPPEPKDAALSLDPLELPDVHHEDRPSGATLLHVHLPAVPLTHLRIVFPVGRAADGDQPGLATMTARTVLQGAVGPDAPTRRQHGLEQVAEYGTQVTADATVFSFAFASTEAEEVIDHLRTMIQQPGFRQSAIQHARASMPQLLASTRRSMAMGDALRGVEKPVSESDLSGIKDWHCRSFHKKMFRAEGARVVWVGDVNLDRAQALTDRLLEGWKTTKASGAPEPPPAKRRVITVGSPRPDDPVQVVMLARGPDRNHEDWPALWIVSQLMTKTCGSLPWAEQPAAFRVCDTVAAGQAERWMGEMEAKLRQLEEGGIPPAELDRTRRTLVEAEARRLGDPRALTDTLALWDASSVDRTGEKLSGVSDVRPAVARHLTADQLVFVIVPRVTTR